MQFYTYVKTSMLCFYNTRLGLFHKKKYSMLEKSLKILIKKWKESELIKDTKEIKMKQI